jgi:hypothetical protein
MDRLPDVSLVFETANDRPGRRIRLAEVVGAWRRQSRADRILEWIVVSSEDPAPAVRGLFEGLPVRWIVRPDLQYYQQKNAGIAQAAAPFVALADADALPGEDWLERALEAFARAAADVALVTGRSRYLPGPFSREMAIAQMPNQANHPCDTTHFLAHNVMLRAGIVRSFGPFSRDANRLGPDTELAGRLIAAGYRLRYEPALRATHNSHRRLTGLYRSCVLTGYAFGRFQLEAGGPRPNRLPDFAGRVRLLLARWRRDRLSLGIPLWRLPLSALFFVAYSAASARGYGLALRGKPKPRRF